jgi:hypothetical protein
VLRVSYPGELQAARAAGQSTAHLAIIEADYHGGQKRFARPATPQPVTAVSSRLIASRTRSFQHHPAMARLT